MTIENEGTLRRWRSPAMIGNRIRECEAQERALRRKLKHRLRKGEHREGLAARLTGVREQLAHWRGELAARNEVLR